MTFDSPAQRATVTTEQGGTRIPLTIGPVQVVPGSLADLKNVKLPATVKGLVPIHVTGTFTQGRQGRRAVRLVGGLR